MGLPVLFPRFNSDSVSNGTGMCREATKKRSGPASCSLQRSIIVPQTNIQSCMSLYTVPFRPSVQSHITAKKTDCFKTRLNSKENLSAFSETKISKIVNTWLKWYSTFYTSSSLPFISGVYNKQCLVTSYCYICATV